MRELTVVTPSKWLAGLVGESFLREYPVEVIHNGIDLQTFQPTASDFRLRHGFASPGAEASPDGPKYMVLGVSFGWSEQKGLDVFEYLAANLGESYRVVLVGTDEALDARLPDGILSIHRTHDQKELAEIYSAADVFVNPTRQEVLGMVNLEALACGTPVVSFRTGGCPECLDESCGSVVPVDDNEGLLREVVRVCETAPYTPEARRRAPPEPPVSNGTRSLSGTSVYMNKNRPLPRGSSGRDLFQRQATVNAPSGEQPGQIT